MTLLDRYIARQFLINFGVLLLIMGALVIVVDFSLQYDEYWEIAEGLVGSDAAHASLRRALLSLFLVWDLWWPRLFQLYSYLLGVLMIGAVGFTCSQMVRHREFVAMLAGGLSLHRVARPILLVSFVLIGAQVLDREVVLPRLATLLTREKNDAGKRGLGTTRQPLCIDANGRLFYIRRVDLDRQKLEGLLVWDRDAQGLMTRRIGAPEALWDGTRWVLTDGVAESRTPDGTVRREPIGTVETDLDPTALRLKRFEGFANNLSTAQVSTLLDRLRQSSQPPVARIEALERNRTGRYAAMVCNVLALLVCLPFFLRREPVNVLAQSLRVAPIAILATLGSQITTTAGIPGLPAQVGVFVPVMVLLPLAIHAITSVRT